MRNSIAFLAAVLTLAAIAPAAATQISTNQFGTQTNSVVVARCLAIPACLPKKK